MMGDLAGNIAQLAAFAAALMPVPDPPEQNWCTPGYVVMFPDGREGVVTSTEGVICRVIADGEAYVTPMPHFILEPVYPQKFTARLYR